MNPDDEKKYTEIIEAMPDVIKVYQFYRNKSRQWIVSLKTTTKPHTTRSLRATLKEAGVDTPHDLVSLPKITCLHCEVEFRPVRTNQRYCSKVCGDEATRPGQTKRSRFALYGITEEDYNRMLAEQDGKCYICKEIPKRMVIDHCHTSGKVRHLLCVRCNSCLGWFETYRTEAEEYVKPLLED